MALLAQLASCNPDAAEEAAEPDDASVPSNDAVGSPSETAELGSDGGAVPRTAPTRAVTTDGDSARDASVDTQAAVDARAPEDAVGSTVRDSGSEPLPAADEGGAPLPTNSVTPPTKADASVADRPDAGSSVDGGDAGRSTDAGGSGGSAGVGDGGASPISNPDPNPSGLPVPGPGDVPAPTGNADNLEVLNWAGFTAAVTYTFDDNFSSQIENYPTLQALGVPMTFYLQTSLPEARDPVWAQALLDGHELGNHTHTHQQSGPDLGADTDLATAFLQENYGVRPWTMATPNVLPEYIEVARTRFLVNRGTNSALIAPGEDLDPFNLPCYFPLTGASEDDFNQRVDSTRLVGSWLVVLLHGFYGGTDAPFRPVELKEFVASVQYAKAFGDVWLDTMVQIGAYWRAQKLFDELIPSISGDSQIFTWTLPDNFPPDKYLRVVVAGGTLSQQGTPIPWNPHGFYEVALDVGSLTLSPE